MHASRVLKSDIRPSRPICNYSPAPPSRSLAAGESRAQVILLLLAGLILARQIIILLRRIKYNSSRGLRTLNHVFAPKTLSWRPSMRRCVPVFPKDAASIGFAVAHPNNRDRAILPSAQQLCPWKAVCAAVTPSGLLEVDIPLTRCTDGGAWQHVAG